MRRSARLMQTQMGVKRKAQGEVVKASEMSNNLASTVRRRGLFQDSQPEEETVVDHDSFIIAEHLPERPVPPSPFLLEQFEVEQDLPPPPLNDENTPPPTRRHVIHTDDDSEMPVDEEMGARANSHHTTDQPVAATAVAADQTTEPATWFTPIRPTRPPVVEPEFTPNGMPSRMPSFALWIDGIEVSEEDLNAAPSAAPAAAAHLPPATKPPTPPSAIARNGGVDMTDLARLYDPQIAAAAARSPPTPIEKICKSLT